MKYIVELLVTYKKNIYIEANSPEEAEKLVWEQGKGLQIGRPQEEGKHQIASIRETEMEIE